MAQAQAINLNVKKNEIPQVTVPFKNTRLLRYLLYPLVQIIPLSSVSDQDRFSLYYVYTVSCGQVLRIKKNINSGITNWSDTKFSKLKQWELFGRQ